MNAWRWIPRTVAVMAGLTLALPLWGQDSGQAPGSLSLARAVEMALESHPAVEAARAEEEVAGARAEQARSARLPTLGSQLSLSRFQEPMVVAPLHEFDPMHPPSFDRTLAQGALALGWTVFDGGARGARIDQAEAGERMAQAGGADAAMGIAVAVSRAYLSVLSGEDVLQAVLAQRAALEAEMGRVRLFLEEGKAARVDLLRVQAALSRVEAQEISARSDLDLAWGNLARLTGQELAGIRTSTLSSLRSRRDDTPAREVALAQAREANPAILRAQEVVAAAAAGRAQTRAAWFPRIEAGGRISDFGTLEGDHVQEWQGSLQLSYPLFTGGARKSDRERAVAEEKRAREALRSVELDVDEAVDQALTAVDEGRALREALQLAEEQSAEVARIEALALEAGSGVQTDFLRAQAELLQARAALSRARHGEVLARLQLARVRGVLSPEWIQENMEMVR